MDVILESLRQKPQKVEFQGQVHTMGWALKGKVALTHFLAVSDSLHTTRMFSS